MRKVDLDLGQAAHPKAGKACHELPSITLEDIKIGYMTP